MIIDFRLLMDRLTETCKQYTKSAPIVSEWANDLFIRINESPQDVVLSELNFVSRLFEDGQWMHPNTAANQHYKLMHRLGRSVVGNIGY